MFASLIAVAIPVEARCEDAPAHRLKQHGAAGDGVFGTADDDAELPGRREIRPTEHGRRDECLARLAVPRLELAHDGDAVRAHQEMDRALRQRFAQAPRAEPDLGGGGILDEHRDDDLAARSHLCDRRCRMRARRGERRGLRRELIEHREFVARVEQAARHPLSHAAEADEPYFHVLLERAY